MRFAAAVIAAVVLAGCTSSSGNPPAASSTGSSSTSTGPSAGDGGALVAVAEEEPLDQDGPRGFVHALALDSAGEPVLLFVPEDEGPLILSRRTGEEWATQRLADQNTFGYSSTVAVADDGTVVVAGYADSRVSITRASPDGAVATVPVDDDLHPDVVTLQGTTLAPDGSTLYVAVVDRRTESRLLAVDPVTGAVRAEHRFPTDPAGLVAPTDIAFAGDQVVVTVDRGVQPGPDATNETRVPWLARFDLDLRPLGEVQLADAGARSGRGALAVDEAGGAYVALVVGEFREPGVEVRLVTAAPDAAAADTLATFPGYDLVGLVAVDPAGEWVYLGGLDKGPDEDLIVTPVDVLAREASDPVTVCSSQDVDGLAVTPDGQSLLVALSCSGRDVNPTLFTFR